MSENFSYNDEQRDDLPLPNEEEAWQKMKLLLDEEDKRRRVLPFWFWRYGLSGLLFLGLATGGYFLLNTTRNDKQTSTTTRQNVPQQQIKQQELAPRKTRNKNSSQENTSETVEQLEKTMVQNSPTPIEKKVQDLPVVSQQIRTNRKANYSTKNKLPQTIKTVPDNNKKGVDLFVNRIQQRIVTNNHQKQTDTVKQLTTKSNKDSARVKDTAKTITTPPIVSTKTEKDNPKKKSSFVWSAGVGLQQAIAFNGQQSSSYNFNGKQSTLSDHIPSVYLRLQKDKWYLQAEFFYGVPYPVEQFSFSQTTTYNAANSTLNTNRFYIQKLYYHQSPLSVNYFVLPNWSLGIGGIYNRLAGAVTEQETTNKNISTGSETISKRLAPVKGYKDSFLYQSTAGILLQTDYHWNRFSLGLRYTKNLQPFIKYTKPDGAVVDEKNQMLQAILRFRLKN